MQAVKIEEKSVEERQEVRAFLRDRFIRVLTSPAIRNKECVVNMFGNTQVRAEFVACNVSLDTLAVQNLVTKLGVIPKALLRAQDILSLHVKVPNSTATI